jgi:hypothetical protein
MKILKTILATSILVMIVASCGNNTPVAVEPTVTTINYGTDCNLNSVRELNRLIDIQEQISLNRGSVPTTKEWQDETNAMEAVRSYVRALDVPLLSDYQFAYVNAIFDFLVAYNTYFQSGKTDLTLNNYTIPYNDSEYDFQKAFIEMCRSKV